LSTDLAKMKTSALLLATACFCLCAGALAQDSPLRVATKEQYAQCLDTADAIEQRSAALSKHNEARQALALKFQAADDDLNAQVKRHAPRTKEEIASYNRAVETRNRSAKEFNEASRSLDREQEALNASVVAHNRLCGSLLISSEVKEAVEQERRARRAKP
jgi:hypothetical protein